MVQGAFGDLLHRSDIAVGLAGTANEQAAGLGKPVVTFVGEGTQFTAKFAKDQKRLLGDAVSLVARDPDVVARELLRILSDRTVYDHMAQAGRERMGEPGGALKMARRIVELFGAASLSQPRDVGMVGDQADHKAQGEVAASPSSHSRKRLVPGRLGHPPSEKRESSQKVSGTSIVIMRTWNVGTFR